MAFRRTMRLLIDEEKRGTGFKQFVKDLTSQPKPPPKRGLNWFLYVGVMTCIPAALWTYYLHSTRIKVERIQEQLDALQWREDWDREHTKRAERAEILEQRRQHEILHGRSTPWLEEEITPTIALSLIRSTRQNDNKTTTIKS